MVSDGAAVRDIMLGEHGVIGAIEPGGLIIDMSTIEPAVSRELAAAAAQRGVGMLDAPVSGGDVGAREATLSIMVGGEASDLDRARAVLGAMGKTITHVGPAGAGQVVKACNQIVVAITYAAVSEALVLASGAGVDRAAVLDVLSGGLAANRIMEMRRRNLLEHDFTPGFRVDLHHKDLRIALDTGDDLDVGLPVAAAVQQMLVELRALGHGDLDHSSLLLIAERRAAAGPAQ
jgi:2-hydroxy-3-oxopropionate reductase